MVQWLALSPHSKRVLGSNPLANWGPSVWSLPVLLVPPWVPPASSHSPKTCKLIGDSKLGVNVSVSGCLSYMSAL